MVWMAVLGVVLPCGAKNAVDTMIIVEVNEADIVSEVRPQRVYRGFSGGMMVHVGYLSGTNSAAPLTMNGATMGIGGAARVHLWKHLRVGGEGFVSTMPVWMSNYAGGAAARNGKLQSGSYVRNGWGGLCADAYWECKKVVPFVGATIGGGAQRLLYISEGSEDDWVEEGKALFNRQVYCLIDPFVGVEFAMTEHIHLIVRVDYALPICDGSLLAPHGPRLYIGMMFGH